MRFAYRNAVGRAKRSVPAIAPPMPVKEVGAHGAQPVPGWREAPIRVRRQEGDHLLARDRRKPCEKLVNRIARFKVIQQCLHRNARVGEHRGAAHHVGIAGYDQLLHWNSFPAR
jgi:hypothetical protein